MTRILASVALVFSASACHFFVDVTPCLDGQACPAGTTCDVAVGICSKPKPPPPPPPPAAGSCDAPLALTLGVPTDGDTSNIGKGAFGNGSCQFGGGDAAELVYDVTRDHDAKLAAIVVPKVPAFDIEVYARVDDCTNPLSEEACADAFIAGESESILFDVKANQPAFLIVDGFNEVDVGPFTLTVNEVLPDGAGCDVNNAAAVCAKGSRCTGTCNLIPGDLCESAVRLDGPTGGESEDTTLMTSQYVATNVCTGLAFTTPAPDMFYVVTLAPNATVSATLTPPATIDLGLYVLPTCPVPVDGGCLAFSDGGGAGVVEHLNFTNTGTAPTDVFIAVDGFAENQVGPFQLDYTITQ